MSLFTAASAAAAPPRVTVIGDSVMTAVWWHEAPLERLAQGLDVQWQVAVCRTVTGVSCPFEGSRPPTLLDLVRTVGAGLGPTVVVELGYNDDPSTFGQAVDEAVWTLGGVGVTHVIWLTLHEALPQFAAMNEQLVAAQQRHPDLTVVDWDAAARGHPEWFQDDGIHLVASGADALADFVNEALTHPAALSVDGTKQSQTAPTPPVDDVLLWHGTWRYSASRSRG